MNNIVVHVNWPAGVPIAFAAHFVEACCGWRKSWDALCRFPAEQAQEWIGLMLKANNIQGKELSQARLHFWRQLHPQRN